MTPLNYYKEQVAKGIIFEDPEQLAAMQHLNRVFLDLLDESKRRNRFFSFLQKPRLVKGLYLWGGVGIGKTFMMDCFYHTLPFSNKMRMHFHQFMQRIHDLLAKHQGESDPLQAIAKELAKKTMVLCFDEFYVSDITDAMLLGRLFKALYAEGVTLVATSNVAPDNLYKNGLQRSQFLPAIALLKENTEVMHIPTVIDYRLRHLKEAGVFYTPLDATAQLNMEKTFAMLTQGEVVETTPISIYNRLISVVKRTQDVIWFDFKEICRVPRSQKDYLAIAKEYRTVFVSDIPVIQPTEKDTICLFISLVDVFYDARVRLVISAAEPVELIYNRGYKTLEYTRTNSRLLEMQSVDYFSGEFDQER
jgi:cell division protein ZapE